MDGTDTHTEADSATAPIEPAMKSATGATPRSDAPSRNASARRIFEELHKRFGRGGPVPNERNSERLPWVTDLTLRVEDPGRTARDLKVATHDVSRGGFSFVYKQFLHCGTKIRTSFDGLPNRPTIQGVVQYCVDCGDGRHRIGVLFALDSSAKAGGRRGK